MIKAVLFDFGGVIAEEGFREGLKFIAKTKGLDPEKFFFKVSELTYASGYVTGDATESNFWQIVRRETGINGSDDELRKEILKRFKLRQEMLDYARALRSSGLVIAILSDQSNWLEEINQNTPFFQIFDHIYNSYRLKKGKKDPTIFKETCQALGFRPEEVLFVDDNIDHIKRAEGESLYTIHFKDVDEFKKEMSRLL